MNSKFMSETKTDKKFPKKEHLVTTVLGGRIKAIQTLQADHENLTKDFNRFREVLQKLEWNQLDSAIVAFHKSVSAYGLTDGEWKSIIQIGLEEILKQLHKNAEGIEELITQKLKS
jgi:hypothetical protein